MMEQTELIAAFDDCVNRLTQGETVADCVRRYPQFAAALRPMLETGLLVRRSLYPAQEVAQAQYRNHLKIAQHAAALHQRNVAPTSRRWLALVASLLIAFMSIFAGVGVAAENSLPGDALYPVKRLTESLRMTLTNNGDLFDSRRLDEARQLLALRREADVEFEGAVDQINGDVWVIEGIETEVAQGTPGADGIRVGDVVRVEGRTTTEGTLIALSVELLRENPEAIPTNTAVPTAAPVTPAPTQTTAPTLTPAPATASATDMATQTPTSTQTRIPTQTPAGTLTPTPCLPSQPEGWVRYQIRAGDTLSGLAGATGTTIDEIVRVNCLPDTRLIVVGQFLFLPAQPPTSAAQPLATQAPVSGGNDPAPQNPPADSGSSGNGGDSGNDDGDSGNDDDSGDDGDSGNDDNDNSGSGGGDDDDDDDNSGSGGGDDDDDDDNDDD